LDGVIDAESILAFAATRAVAVYFLAASSPRVAGSALRATTIVSGGAVGNADTTETPQAWTAGVALVADALAGARADAVAADVAGASRILRAIRNVPAVEFTEDILGALATGSANLIRIEGDRAGAIGAAEGSAALSFFAALLSSRLVAVEDALSFGAAEAVIIEDDEAIKVCVDADAEATP
jgi:hypothetical protein